MDDPNITIEEYIRLEEEEAHRRSQCIIGKLLRMVVFVISMIEAFVYMSESLTWNGQGKYSVLIDHLIRRIHQLDIKYQTFYPEQRIGFYSLNGVSVLPNNMAYSVNSIRRLFDTPSLIESNSPEFDQISNIEEHVEEEVRETMRETTKQYLSKTRGDYGSSVTRPAINQDTQFELKGKFFKELHDSTFSGSEHKGANEHIKKFLEIFDLFHIPKITQDQIMLRAFPVSLTGATNKWLRNQPLGAILTKTAADAKVAINEMAKFSQKWHNETSSKFRSTETSDRLATIPAQLNNLGREIKKVNEKVYVSQVECELCKGPHYTKDCLQKEEGKTLEEAYYTQFGAPYQPEGQYRPVGPRFYQRNNGNSSYHDRRPSMTIKQPRGIAENVLVRIGKFVFLIDFIILDIPEDDDVPLIIERPFLSTALSKIDVFKRKITLRVGEEKLVF
nr:hypothetical protein [Tanacetum cinerariifolium]